MQPFGTVERTADGPAQGLLVVPPVRTDRTGTAKVDGASGPHEPQLVVERSIIEPVLIDPGIEAVADHSKKCTKGSGQDTKEPFRWICRRRCSSSNLSSRKCYPPAPPLTDKPLIGVRFGWNTGGRH
jgi:hypothetical protein